MLMLQFNCTKKVLGTIFVLEHKDTTHFSWTKKNKTEMIYLTSGDQVTGNLLRSVSCVVLCFCHSPAGTSGPSAQWSSLTSASQLFHPTPSFLLDRHRHGTRWGTDQRAVWHLSVYLSQIWFIKHHSALLPFFLCTFRSYAPWLQRFFISSSCPHSAGFWRRRGSRTWPSRAALGIA